MSTWTNSANASWSSSSGGYSDKTGLGVVSAFSVPLGTRRVRYLHTTTTTVITWPGARMSDAVFVNYQGLYVSPTVNDPLRRDSGRVLSPGIVHVYLSGGNGTPPTPTDVKLEQ